MDEGTKRPGLFEKGGVGRFLLGLTLGAMVFSTCAFGLLTGIVMLGSAGFMASRLKPEEWGQGWKEGTAFADGHTITECVGEVERRGPAECANLIPLCDLGVSAFTGACISAATDDGYCAPVPDTSEIESSVEWKRASCAAFPGRWCDTLIRDVQNACELRKNHTSEDAHSEEEAKE